MAGFLFGRGEEGDHPAYPLPTRRSPRYLATSGTRAYRHVRCPASANATVKAAKLGNSRRKGWARAASCVGAHRTTAHSPPLHSPPLRRPLGDARREDTGSENGYACVAASEDTRQGAAAGFRILRIAMRGNGENEEGMGTSGEIRSREREEERRKALEEQAREQKRRLEAERQRREAEERRRRERK
jgi:hypothetical protein